MTAYPNEPAQNASFGYQWLDSGDPSSGGGNPWHFTQQSGLVNFGCTVTDQCQQTVGVSAVQCPTSFTPDTPNLSITENDPGGKVLEGTPANFLIKLTGTLPHYPNDTITCFVQTQDGTAAAATDYELTNGPQLVTFNYNPTTSQMQCKLHGFVYQAPYRRTILTSTARR